MYETPIKLIEQQMETEIEGMVLHAVQRVGADVDDVRQIERTREGVLILTVPPAWRRMEGMKRPRKRRRRAIGKAMRQVFRWRMRRWEKTLRELERIDSLLRR